MPVTNYYYLYRQDGSCEVICTRCFLTIGGAADDVAARQIKIDHLCSKDNVKSPSGDATPARSPAVPIDRSLTQYRGTLQKIRWLRAAIMLTSAASLCYLFPTIVELAALREYPPWIPIVLLGDLAGCTWLIVVLRRLRLGVLLYLLLAVCKSLLYLCHTAPANAVWIVDSIPTLIILGITAHPMLTAIERHHAHS